MAKGNKSVTTLMLIYIITRSRNGLASDNIEVLVNESASVNCTPNASANIEWHFRSTTNDSIYAEGQFSDPYKDRFRLEYDETSGTHSLIIPAVKPMDAGLYECSDGETSQLISSTQLTVLYSNPVCDSNMHPDGFVGPNTCDLEQENMTFHCTVAFSGNPPHLTWSSSLNESHPINSSHCDNQPNRISCTVTMRPDPLLNGSVLICQTSTSSGTQYSCTTEVIKINQFFSDHESTEKKVNDYASCLVESVSNVHYKWTLKQNSEVIFLSSNRTILIQQPGIYQCEVQYKIRNVTCLVSVANVSVYAADSKKERKDQGCCGLTESPQNVAVYVGQRTSFFCQPSNGSLVFEWLYNKLDGSRGKIFTNWNSRQVGDSKYGLYTTEYGAVEIYLNETEMMDAGRYTCAVEIKGKVVSSHAELIVIESEPECNVTEYIDHRIRVGCTVVFSGKLTPTMEWRYNRIGHTFEEGTLFKDGSDVEKYSNETHVMSTLKALVLNSDKESFTVSCKIYFDSPDYYSIDSASNIPDFVYIWNSSVFGATKSTPDANGTTAVAEKLYLGETEESILELKEAPNNENMTLMYIVVGLAFALFLLMIGTVAYVVRKRKRKARKLSAKRRLVDDEEKKGRERPPSGDYEAILYDEIGYEMLDHEFSPDENNASYGLPGKILPRHRVTNGYEEPIGLLQNDDKIVPYPRYLKNSGQSTESDRYAPLDSAVGGARKEGMDIYLEIIADTEEDEESKMNQLTASSDGCGGNDKMPAESANDDHLPDTGCTSLILE